jgi:multidrug efflux pump subunit AcrA (membrane-fusion protein)
MIPVRLPVVLVLGIAALDLAGCTSESQPRNGPAAAPAVSVALTPRALAVTDVTTETARVVTLPETFTTTGEIEFDPARVVVVNAPVAGRLMLLTRNVGDRVAAGDTLVTLASPEFLSGALSITAPRGGIVTALGAAPHQVVPAGAELLRIAAVDRVWLRVDLYGDRGRFARVGDPVEARVAMFSELALRGRITSMAPSVEGATQAMAARVPLANPSGRLLPGMFADVQVATGRNVRGVLVPQSAILYDGSRRLVMIAHDSTYFPSVVIPGPVIGDRVTILRGVNPGERVVVNGAFELYSAGYAFTRGAEEEGEEK